MDVSCRQAFQIDLPGFLAEPRARVHAAFREHYPDCRECAAEVRVWTELHLALNAGVLPFEHPPEEMLLRWEEEPGRLAPSERRALDAHLERCASCSDELASMRSMMRRLTVEEPHEPGWLARAADRLRVVALHPAFAYALVGLLLFPALKLILGDIERTGGPASLARDAPRVEPPSGLARRSEDRLRARAPALEAGRSIAPAPAARPRAYASAGSAREERASSPEPSPPAPRPAIRSRESLHKRLDTVRGAVPEEEGVSDELEASADRGSPPLAGLEVPPARDEFAFLADSSLAQEPARAPKAMRAASPPASPESVVVLTRSAPADVKRPAPGEELVLRVPVPRRAPRGADIQLRVISPDGEREQVESQQIPLAQKPLELRLPSEWLEPGSYQLELRYREPRTEEDTVETLRFRVH